MPEENSNLMASEHAFLHQRLALVEQWLTNPEREFIPADKGRVRRRTQPADRQAITYKREARLLRKLLVQIKERQVLKALRTWRGNLGTFLWEHQQQHHEMQENYDAWWRLPRDERPGVPKPPRPPAARYTDVDGATWIIDDRFLALLDDLIERLLKWLGDA